MSKYYNLNGFHSKTKSHGEASINAPTDDTKLWNWNGVEWIGLPLDFKYPTVNASLVSSIVIEGLIEPESPIILDEEPMLIVPVTEINSTDETL